MALYEQLSTPSQRFNSSASSSFPLLPHKGSTLVPSASAIQGYGHERSFSSPFDVPPHPPAHSVERVHSRSSDRMSLTTTRMEFGRSSKMDANNSTSNARGSAAECDSHHPPNSSNAKKSRGKNYEDGDDFMVSTFVQSGIAVFSNKNLPASPLEKLTTFSAISPQKSCSSPCPNFNDKPLEGTNTNDMKSGNIERNHSEQKRKETTVIKDSTEIPDCRRRFAEPSNFAKISSDQDPTGMVNVVKNSRHGNAELHPEATGNGALGGPRCSNGIDVVRKGGDSRVRNECCSKSSPRNSQSSPNEADKFNQKSDDKPHGSLELGDRDRNEVSEASMMDSISSMEISPDDVVAVIGPKHFWKARRAIVNQQRVFAVQVFELHRLIKVQKLIAASPDVLEANLYLSHSPTKVPTKNLPPENIGKSHQPTVKQKGLSQKPNQNTECPEENTIIDPPPCQIPRSGSAPVPSAPDNRPSPWCFQQPLNQWLVPVMSPSEALVYKPYTGPCPPTTGFMAPFYGGCAPLSFPPVAGDFMNLSYAIPPSHQQPPNYFPIPYGLPIMNPIMSSAVKQVSSPLVGPQPNVHDPQHSWSSYNVLNSRSEAISGRVRKFQASKESEVQGSTVSSPREEAREAMDALTLPPMDWVSEGTNRPSESCGRDNQTRVIRVVPHNARSATMSAARIFQSIQEERRQYDS